MVGDFLQQNLQGADPFSLQSTDRLVELRFIHQQAPGANGDASGYRWDAILPQAKQHLTESQWNGLQTSVASLRAEAQLKALQRK